jgi:hypothetical protein
MSGAGEAIDAYRNWIKTSGSNLLNGYFLIIISEWESIGSAEQ